MYPEAHVKVAKKSGKFYLRDELNAIFAEVWREGTKVKGMVEQRQARRKRKDSPSTLKV